MELITRLGKQEVGYILINGTDNWVHYYSNKQINTKGVTNGTFNIKQGKVFLDDKSYLDETNKTFTLNYTTYIFAGNWKGTSAEQLTAYKLYYFKIGIYE